MCMKYNSQWHVSFSHIFSLECTDWLLMADASILHVYHVCENPNPKCTIWIFDIFWYHIRLFENHLDNFIVYVQSLTHPSPEHPVLRTVAGWLRHSLHSFTCTSFLRTMLTMNHGFSISKLKCWTAEMLIYMQHAVILILWSLCNIWYYLMPCLFEIKDPRGMVWSLFPDVALLHPQDVFFLWRAQ